MTPYDIARNIGAASGKALEGRMQQDLIGQILSQVGTDPSKAQLGINEILTQVMPQYQNPPLKALQGLVQQGQQQQKQQQVQEAEQMKAAAEQKEKETVKSVYDRLVELTPKVGYLKSYESYASPKTRENIGEFQALLGTMESELVKRVNKGTLSNARFNYITENLLPKPTDTQATIRGKLKGIARELEIETPSVVEAGEEIKKDGKKRSLESFFIEAKS